MRIIFTLLLLAGLQTSAQFTANHCKSTAEIARMEMMNHSRIAGDPNGTSASTNFDVKYYRCEWEVDPAL